MPDIIDRIESYIGRKFALKLQEQLLLDARDEILSLRQGKKDILAQVIKIIEDYEVYDPYIVGKMKIRARKNEIIKQIKAIGKK